MDTIPLWVDVVVGIACTLICWIPYAVAVFFGWHVNKDGNRWGLAPLMIGVVAGLVVFLLTAVSIIGNTL